MRNNVFKNDVGGFRGPRGRQIVKGDTVISYVRKIVILDEAQFVPVEFLGPILATIKLLVEYHNVSFVICTATQPVLIDRPGSNMTDPRLPQIIPSFQSQTTAAQLFVVSAYKVG
jgi:hypothetical protein